MSHLLSESQISTPKTGVNLKSTPGRSGGLNKSTFTPCRRLGLSRRFKGTPNSRNQGYSPNSSCVSTPSSSVSEVEVNIESSNDEKSNMGVKRNDELLSKKENNVKNEECFNTECVTSTPVSKSKKSKKSKITSKNKTSIKQKECQSLKESDTKNKSDPSAISIENSKDEALTIHPEMIKKSQAVKVDEIKKLNTKVSITKQPSDSSSNSENDCLIFNRVENTKEETKLVNSQILKEIHTLDFNEIKKTKSSFAKRLSIKKTGSSQDELTDKEDLLSTPKSSTSSLISEILQKECSVDMEIMESLNEIELPVLKTSNKKRRVIYSSDEEDFVSSQPVIKKTNENQQQDDENWNKKITEIQFRINQKKEHLEELKRAAIYKKLHNVTELNKLTDIWKKGCQDGLIHLLRKTREHVEMDMPTLMKNLKIPPMIVYDKETDSFM